MRVEGASWQVPSTFASHELKLDKRMITADGKTKGMRTDAEKRSTQVGKAVMVKSRQADRETGARRQ